MPRRPCHPARLHTRPPNNRRKIPSCSKLPIALYLGCSTFNAGRPSSAPLQVSVVFSIPPQSATSRWRPLEWVQRMQRVYDKPARVPARKADKFSYISRHSTISVSLFRVWEPEPERGEYKDYEPDADWRTSALRFFGRERREDVFSSFGGVHGARQALSLWRLVLREFPFGGSWGGGGAGRGARGAASRGARAESCLAGVAACTSLVFLLGNLVRGERACTKFGGEGGAPQSRGAEELTTSCCGRASDSDGHILHPSPLGALKSIFFNSDPGFGTEKKGVGNIARAPVIRQHSPTNRSRDLRRPAITDLHSPHTKALYDPAIVCGGRRAWRARERAKATVSRRSEGCTVGATQHARHRAHEEKRGWGGGVDGAARPGLLQHSVGHRAMWAELQVVVGVLASAEQRSVAGLGHVEDRTVCMPRGREDGAAGPLRVAYCDVRPWARRRRILESNNGARVVAGVSSYGTGVAKCQRTGRTWGMRLRRACAAVHVVSYVGKYLSTPITSSTLCLHTLTVLHRPPATKALEVELRPRMHTETAREMARRTRIKPAYPLHAGRGVAAKRGLVLQLGPPPLVAVAVVRHPEARKMSPFVVVDRSRLVDRAR
ncbi:hypothetical protein B0H14DRAFT_3544053 [Mycena olivaceomarginata]|nr:hypothetical protein B0H14DRAFT_3544053 [Mycena olivaceomarginata]